MFSDSMCQNTSADVQIISSTSYGCPGGPENSDSWLCGPFSANHILSLDVDKKHWPRRGHKSANFWLAENGKAGEEQGFIMSLGCNKRVAGVNIRNTQNAYHRDRSTKKFRILGSVAYDGPWQELLVANLEDSRPQDPPPVQTLTFDKPSLARFVKFELLEFWGTEGGGLQYLQVIPGFYHDLQISIEWIYISFPPTPSMSTTTTNQTKHLSQSACSIQYSNNLHLTRPQYC